MAGALDVTEAFGKVFFHRPKWVVHLPKMWFVTTKMGVKKIRNMRFPSTRMGRLTSQNGTDKSKMSWLKLVGVDHEKNGGEPQIKFICPTATQKWGRQDMMQTQLTHSYLMGGRATVPIPNNLEQLRIIFPE